jgi:hypothetical protein
MSEAAIEEQASALLRAYADGIKRRDREAVLGLFTLDALAIGTGADEWTRAELRWREDSIGI